MLLRCRIGLFDSRLFNLSSFYLGLFDWRHGPTTVQSRAAICYEIGSKQPGRREMSTLVVIEYDDMFKAEETRLRLRKMQKDYLIDLEDAVVAVKDQQGKVKLHQAVNLTAAGALTGGFWGALIGLIFLNPLLGIAVGAG